LISSFNVWIFALRVPKSPSQGLHPNLLNIRRKLAFPPTLPISLLQVGGKREFCHLGGSTSMHIQQPTNHLPLRQSGRRIAAITRCHTSVMEPRDGLAHASHLLAVSVHMPLSTLKTKLMDPLTAVAGVFQARIDVTCALLDKLAANVSALIVPTLIDRTKQQGRNMGGQASQSSVNITHRDWHWYRKHRMELTVPIIHTNVFR
jgi:hypothetical protein